MRFEDFNELFLHLCHNPEYEEIGMIRNYKMNY